VRIGVTGASGFIGAHLVSQMSARADLEIIALTRTLGPEHVDDTPNVRWVQGDLGSPHDCARFVKDLDAVVHLAHVNTPLTSNRDLSSDAALNLGPTLTLLRAIRDRRKRPRIVYASSGGAVYARTPDGKPLTEVSPVEPTSSYGILKLTVESYLRMAAGEGWISGAALRIGNAYGALLPRDRLQGFLGVAIHEAAAGRPVRIFGDPENVRDYVHLRDITDAFARALEARTGWDVYNIGSGRGTSVRQLMEILQTVAGPELSVEFDRVEVADAELLPHWAVLDSSRARSELGWEPTIELEKGIQELWEGARG
jgi:UDP-glucose 4-epimerase